MEANRKRRRVAGLPARRIDRRQRIGLLVLLLGLLTVMGQAQISPSDDAYVNSAAPTTNYGAATTLNLQSAADTAFIRFDLTAVPAGYTGSSIAKATLKLYVNSATTAGSFNVDYVIGTWTEKTITYSLQPAIGTTIAASVPLTTASKGKYVEIDVTAAVVEWLNGTQANDGIALVANSPFVATFDSKENTSASHPPELDLVFAGIAGITTTSGSGLTGGGASGTLNLSLLTSCAANQVLRWNGTAWACSSSGTGTVTSVGSGLGLKGGPITGSGTLSIDTTTVPLLNAANTFTGNQSVSGDLSSTGTVTGQQIISTTSNSAPLVVNSAIQIPNLNASLLGGLAPSAFATSGANTFSTTQTIANGDLSLSSGNVDLPFTSGASAGVINLAGGSFIHSCCRNSIQNTFIGSLAGNFTADATASNGGYGANTAVGVYALQGLTSGYHNAASGWGALINNTAGYYNTAVGSSALYNNTTGYENTAIGYGALFNNTGYSNTATGSRALNSNTAGAYNTATGYQALYRNTTGNFNIATGQGALIANATGSWNIAIGDAAGQNLPTGDSNIMVGVLAGASFTSNESNNIDIGNPGFPGDSGVTRIGQGGLQTATYIAAVRSVTTGNNDAVPVLIDSNGQLGTVSSSRRYKEDIHDMGDASDRLLHLRPVTFHYKKPYADGSKPIQYGLIAEEVAEVYPDLVVRGKDGQVETVQYYKLDAMLLNEVQKLAQAHAADQKHLADLTKSQAEQTKTHAADQAEMEQLRSQIEEQQKQITARNRDHNDERSELVRLRTEVERLAAMVRTSNPTVVQANASAPRTK